MARAAAHRSAYRSDVPGRNRGRAPPGGAAVRRLVEGGKRRGLGNGGQATQRAESSYGALLVLLEGREMLGLMPPQASPQPQCPCPDTSACICCFLRDCSRATGFIPLGHDEVRRRFVDGLR